MKNNIHNQNPAERWAIEPAYIPFTFLLVDLDFNRAYAGFYKGGCRIFRGGGPQQYFLLNYFHNVSFHGGMPIQQSSFLEPFSRFGIYDA